MTGHDDEPDRERDHRERDHRGRDDRGASADRPASIEAFHGLAAAYALDALEADERAAFERALAESPELRDEVGAYAESAAHLADQVEPSAPPPSLRERLMAQVETTPQVAPDAAGSAPADVASAPPGVAPAETAARRRWFQRPGAIIAAAAAAVVLVAGVVIGVGWPGPNGWGAQRELAAIAAAPDARSQTLEVEGGGEITLVSSAERGRSAVVAEGLPELDADQTYELWYIDDAGAAPAGTFDVRGDETWRILEGEFTPGVVVGVTVEPAGGSPQPTTEPIVAIAT